MVSKFVVSPIAQKEFKVLGGQRPSGANARAQEALENARKPKPRGRPRKIVVEPVQSGSLEFEVSNLLSHFCGIPGCGPKLHLEDASKVIELVKRNLEGV